MKTFIDIFKIDEVKKFVELKEENMNMKVEHTLNNSERLKEVAEQAVRNSSDKIAEVHNQQMKADLMELVEFVFNHLKSLPENERVPLVENNFPRTKRFFSRMVEDMSKKHA